MAKPSARVAARIQSARTVGAAIDTQSARVAQAFDRAVPEVGANVALAALLGAGAALGRATADLDAKESAYAAELSDDDAPRAWRDAAVARGIATLGAARRAVEAGVGEGGAAAYGLAGDAPRDGPKLLAVLRAAERLLAATPKQVSDPFGNPFNTESVRPAIGEAATELDAALTGVATEAREAQVALVDRDRALDNWQAIYVFAAGVAEVIFRAAGEGRLADHLRPTTRKASGEDVVEPLPPEPAPTPAPEPA
ncbi:MAG: hypothetical protein FJ100_13180 [Deltaproteobacteria bacterium]|nr:hypothetical protein [Deltaproteobacteria bacterium]